SPADAAPRGDWWEIYHDKTLDGLEQKIDTSNPDLAIALSRYDQARQYAAEAAAASYPEIDLAGSGSQNRQSDDRPLRAGGPDEYADNILEGSFTYELD